MHSDHFAESLDELEVVSNGLPLPRPEPSVVVEVAGVAVMNADDVDDVVTAGGTVVAKTDVEALEIVAMDVGGTKVRLVVDASCVEVVCTVVEGGGIIVKEPTLADVVADGVVRITGGTDVLRVADGVLLTDVNEEDDAVVFVVVDVARVTTSKRQASMINMPFWAKYKTEFWAALTVSQLLSTSSSIDRIPDRQSLEQSCPEEVKSAAVQPSMVAW